MIDWVEAGRVSGIGFGMVIIVLSILALATYAMGMILRRLATGSGAQGSNLEQNKKD